MKILGYSERGIINSLIFSIGENKPLMNKFIELIDLPKPFQLGKPKDFTILLEQSFSRFGDADLIIIIHYEKPEQNKVLFIEGKVKTYQKKNWSLEKQFNEFNKPKKYNGYSSNLFFQLHLKKLLIDNWNDIDINEYASEPKFKDVRKIGNNPIVKKAFKILECKEAYYVGLIPTLQDDIKKFKGKADFDISFLSWESVHSFCGTHKKKLNKVLDIFKYNEGQIY